MTEGTSRTIRTAIVGLGNCASALVQGVAYCRAEGEAAIGVDFPLLGGYRPEDIEFVAAFDIDARKVGKPMGEAIFAAPNCTAVFFDQTGDVTAPVLSGPVLDGVAGHMTDQPDDRGFELTEIAPLDKDGVVAALRNTGAEVMVIFLPVGSVAAVQFYVECALEAGVAVVNGIPVFVASDPVWAAKFEAAGIPILGDDFKAQLGATIVHRTLARLADMRGVKLDKTYQLNVGGNTDFLNMMEQGRLASKRESKTEAVQNAMQTRLKAADIRVGPSDYVPWLQDRKVAYIRLVGRLFGGVETSVEVRLEVEDSPNAAVEAITAIRCCRIARDRGLAGAIHAPSAFLFKHPPEEMTDAHAFAEVQVFAGLTPEEAQG